MSSANKLFTALDTDVNNRNIDVVIAQMTTDVQWANGMEGGFVFGHAGVRDYWTRQFSLISSQVTPAEIVEVGGLVRIKVHQVAHDLSGKLLVDEFVTHLFTLKDGK